MHNVSRFIHIYCTLQNFPSFKSWIIFLYGIYHIVVINSCADGHSDCFHIEQCCSEHRIWAMTQVSPEALKDLVIHTDHNLPSNASMTHFTPFIYCVT